MKLIPAAKPKQASTYIGTGRCWWSMITLVTTAVVLFHNTLKKAMVNQVFYHENHMDGTANSL